MYAIWLKILRHRSVPAPIIVIVNTHKPWKNILSTEVLGTPHNSAREHL